MVNVMLSSFSVPLELTVRLPVIVTSSSQYVTSWTVQDPLAGGSVWAAEVAAMATKAAAIPIRATMRVLRFTHPPPCASP